MKDVKSFHTSCMGSTNYIPSIIHLSPAASATHILKQRFIIWSFLPLVIDFQKGERRSKPFRVTHLASQKSKKHGSILSNRVVFTVFRAWMNATATPSRVAGTGPSHCNAQYFLEGRFFFFLACCSGSRKPWQFPSWPSPSLKWYRDKCSLDIYTKKKREREKKKGITQNWCSARCHVCKVNFCESEHWIFF